MKNIIYAIKSTTARACKVVNAFLKRKVGRYVVVDGQGTRQHCWRLVDAYEWISYGAQEWVVVIDRLQMAIVAERKQKYVY